MHKHSHSHVCVCAHLSEYRSFVLNTVLLALDIIVIRAGDAVLSSSGSLMAEGWSSALPPALGT